MDIIPGRSSQADHPRKLGILLSRCPQTRLYLFRARLVRQFCHQLAEKMRNAIQMTSRERWIMVACDVGYLATLLSHLAKWSPFLF